MGTGFTVKGITADVTNCECCPRRGLRKTVVLMPLDADGNEFGEPTHYGTTCAARALRVSPYEIRRAARAAEITTAITARAALRAAARLGLDKIRTQRDRLLARLEAGTATDTAAGALAFATALGVARWSPERQDAVNTEARAAFTSGGFPALLAVVASYETETARIASLDPAEV
ncbi:hypothetical protein ACFU6S_32695 [Streptomyces sp. NPDC057456]|uniref:hypothetical protein n=1 Tax=Streptomyces sp. NPDC057456 TaxID=3346139 RepID=UPI003678A1D8